MTDIDSGSPEAEARERLEVIGFAETERRLAAKNARIEFLEELSGLRAGVIAQKDAEIERLRVVIAAWEHLMPATSWCFEEADRTLETFVRRPLVERAEAAEKECVSLREQLADAQAELQVMKLRAESAEGLWKMAERRAEMAEAEAESRSRLLKRRHADEMIAHRWFAEHFGELMNGRDFAVKCPMATEQLTAEQKAREEETARLERIMIGGNHLASALIGMLGAGEREFPPYTASIETAQAAIPDPDKLDLWICWQVIMRERDAARSSTGSPKEDK